ncbi:ABC transporter permease [Cohnella terricola]|uniref:Transport permease protein n=1 Tax=Cohnella terricola TaxID=1289167 RepID=A0A559JB41_9BACL|nr:ABC transporter permease [Cohnella terricola]TVX97077.1 ABC transporter permease [Cohnella terricola]
MLRELWVYRTYIYENAIADLRNRYAGSLLGVLWNIIQPLFQILIFTFIFSEIMVARLPGIDSASAFATYLCAGILPWGAFTDTVLRGTNALVVNATYLKKLPVPEHIFIAQVVLSSFLLLSVSMILLLIVVLINGGMITSMWLLMVPLLMLFQLFGFGIALTFGVINVFFRDVGQFLGTLIQIWMWMTPIVYLKEIVPDYLQDIFLYNPAFWFIDSLHKIIVFSELPSLMHWIVMASVTIISLVTGSLVLKKLRSEIRDVL